MELDDTNHTIFIKCPTTIKRSCIPKEKISSHLPIIVGKKNEMTILCFIRMELQDPQPYHFSAKFTSDWATHIYPATKGDHADTHKLPTSITHHVTLTVTSTQDPWTLMRHPLLILFWGAGTPLHHCTTAPLNYCTTALLNHCTTAPLHHLTTSRLCHCATIPLYH